MKTLNAIDLGSFPYEDTYFLQKKILREIDSSGGPDHILLLEHPNIFTVGRTGSRENILVDKGFLEKNRLRVIDVDRGGDITFHGKGQLVLYPIFDLKRHAKDLRLFIKNLESMLNLTISEYGLKSDKEKKYTGLWSGGSKLGFIGIGVSKWITYHGVSLNVDVDLKYFSFIRPCGIPNLQVTSLEAILNKKIDSNLLKDILLKKCCEVFGFEYLRRYSKDAFMAQERAS